MQLPGSALLKWKSASLILFSIFLAQAISGQSKINISAEILSVQKSSDGSLVAITTKDSVFVLNSSTLAVQKKWQHGLSSPVLVGFHPKYNNVLLMQRQMISNSAYSGNLAAYGLSPAQVLENYQTTDRKFSELPEDSIYMWDVNTQQVTQTAAGNYYVQFGNKQNSIVAIMNEIYSYQYEGKNRFGARSAEITTMSGEKQFSSKIKKTCRRLLLAPTQDHFAASFRNGYTNDTLYFSFSVMDFSTHVPVLNLNHLLHLPSDFCFSKDGQLLAVANEWNKEEGKSIKIFDLKNGQQVEEIKEVTGAQNMEFSPSGQELFYTDKDGNWFAWNIQERRVAQKIWAGLAGLSKINSVLVLNNGLTIAGESWNYEVGKPIGSEKKFSLSAMPLIDFAVFSKTEKAKTESFADSTAYSMLLNDVPVSNNTAMLRFSTDKRIFSRVENNQLQLWDAKKKRKVVQLIFEKEIKAFPDKTGNQVLVIEQKNQKSYNEYTLHLLSLNNSTKKTSAIQERGAAAMDGSYASKCDCVPDPVQALLWYCADGSNKVWEVSGKDFSMKPVITTTGTSVSRLTITPSGKLYMFGDNENKKNDVWVKTKEGQPVKIISSTAFRFMTVVAEQVWLWNERLTPQIEIWKDDHLEKTMQVPGPVRTVDATADLESAVVQYDVKSKIYIQRFVKGVPQIPQNTDLISSTFYMLQSDELLAENNSLTSYLKNGSFAVPWSVQTPQILDITNFDVSANGQYVLFSNRIIDLKEIEQWNIYKYNAAALLSDTGKLNWIEIYSEGNYGNKKGGFTLHRFTQGKKDTLISKTWVTEPESNNFFYKHNKIITSPDNNWAFTFVLPYSLNKGYPKAPPMLWNLKTMTGVVVSKLPESFAAAFSSDNKTLKVTISDLNEKDFSASVTEQVYNLNPVKLVQTRKLNSLNRFSEDEDTFVRNGRGVDWLQKDGDSMKVKRSFNSREDLKQVFFDKRTQKIIAGSASGNIIIWEKNGSPSPVVLKAHSAPVEQMILRGERMYTLASNGEIGLTNIRSNQFKVQVKTLVKEDELRIAMFTPEGYYRVDPDLMNQMHFIKNGETFPLSSFELQGNRPDKVYAAIGFSDTFMISALEQSWRTRIRRAGFNPDMPVDNNARPIISWSRDELPAFTSEPEIKISFVISDKQKDLNTLFIKVNGVPLQGRKGQAFLKGTRSIALQPNIKLSEGANNISLVAVNGAGAESLEEIFDIYYEPAVKKKSRLLYIGIGVSAYSDSLMNLRYAAKDVEDIGERIKYYFDSVKVISLLNSEATKENILGVKKLLQQTSLEDVVLLSFSGHGMIAEGKGFFFAPHEMNFKDPAASGISMEMIENLLDDIPARKRLLLLDACHSGEEWNNFIAGGPLPDSVSATSLRGVKIGNKATLATAANRNSYLLMKELFSDFSRGNGAFMISAAANNEYAFEGGEWKNGVFTLSFLQSLGKLRYGGSFGSKAPIRVRDLRKRIYTRVYELTNGLQNPTSRQENGWWNWSF